MKRLKLSQQQGHWREKMKVQEKDKEYATKPGLGESREKKKGSFYSWEAKER